MTLLVESWPEQICYSTARSFGERCLQWLMRGEISEHLWQLWVIDSFFSLHASFVAGRGWGFWLVLDLPVNQIHQESVAEEINIMQQRDVAGAKKTNETGFPKYMQHQSEAVWQVCLRTVEQWTADAEYAWALHASRDCCECCTLVLLQTAGADG